MKKPINTIYIIANTIIEPGMSGGTSIMIESAKVWLKKKFEVIVFTSNAGKELCLLNNLQAKFITWNLPYRKNKYSKLEAFLMYVIGTFKGLILIFRITNKKMNYSVYSNSDFWPDLLPGFLSKLRNKNTIWAAAFYLFAPKPWVRNSLYKGIQLPIGIIYWLSQVPAYFVIKRYADKVFVTSQPDVQSFITNNRTEKNILVVKGGVDLELPKQVKDFKNKKYDAVFMGRLHPQKGVFELLDIWKLVLKIRPNARLAIIGHGSLEKEMKLKAKHLKINNNIDFLGFMTGIPKIKIFKQSKIVLHPAIYDSGGMAACEAMACGLPGISFDLEALKTYYPKGMLKVTCFNKELFANEIIRLLENKQLYKKLQIEALNWSSQWDWNKTGLKLLNQLMS